MKYSEDPVKGSRISGKLASYRAVNDTFDDLFIHFTGDDSGKRRPRKRTTIIRPWIIYGSP